MKVVKKLGFYQRNSNYTLFIKRLEGDRITILSVYIDDTVLTGNSELAIGETNNSLSKEFKVNELGELKYFLGVEVVRAEKGITINQQKYTLDLLKKTEMLECKPLDIPMEQDARKKY